MSDHELRDDAPPEPADERAEMEPPQPEENEPSPHEGEEGQEVM